MAISQAQLDDVPPEMGGGRVVHNPIDTAEWPFTEDKQDYVLWMGRMSPDKGPHRAIAAARVAGVPLVLAGPVQPGQEKFFAEEVEPHLGRDGIDYVGEADGDRKRELYRHAGALLMPIRWPEPFGLVMVEALACGTPVIAFREGAAPEVVQDGETGFVVADEDAMAASIARVGEIDPAACRESCEQRFGVPAVVAAYEEVYRHAVGRAAVALEPYGVQVYDTAGATVGAVPTAIAPTLTITDLAAGDNVFKVTAKNVNGTSPGTAALTKTMTDKVTIGTARFRTNDFAGHRHQQCRRRLGDGPPRLAHRPDPDRHDAGHGGGATRHGRRL